MRLSVPACIVLKLIRVVGIGLMLKGEPRNRGRKFKGRSSQGKETGQENRRKKIRDCSKRDTITSS